MAYLREGIDAHVRELFTKGLNSTYIQRNAALYFMGLGDAEAKGKLGQPKASATFGGASLGQSEVKNQLGSMERQYKFQLTEPDDGAAIEYGGQTPVPAGFAEDNEGTIGFRWFHNQEPLQLRKHSLEFAKGETAIGSIVEESTGPVLNRFLKRHQTLLWHGGTGSNGSQVDMNSASQQNKKMWAEPLGILYTLTKNNYYGRVNRTDETLLNPMVVDASSAFETTLVSLDICRDVNIGYVDQDSGSAVDGLCNKDPMETGPRLFITTAALFKELMSQAEARGIRVITGGIPDHPISGYRYPIIEHDNVFYTWDKDCPAGTMVGLHLDFWLMEIARGHNFVWSGFTDKSKNEQGGEYIEWGNFDAQYRLSCKRPDLQVKIENLTAA